MLPAQKHELLFTTFMGTISQLNQTIRVQTEMIKDLRKTIEEHLQESKGRPQQIPLDEWCKENYGISAAGYYYRVRKVKEAYLDQVSEEKLQENLAIVPKELFHEDQGVQKNPSKLQTTDSFLDIFQDDLRIRIYENTDEQLLFRVLRNLKNAE